ncbi:hypothetical protein F5I97DRAFT_1931482 [Phlebopus sp. FC_14]|nr:hypothetical protein F5I97DRAFT_1931482 [Phlebopus sp. FC_14]
MAPPAPHTIGSQKTPGPLVSVEQVKGHLRLLRAFHNLRITVEDCKDNRIPECARHLDKDKRWRWFIHLAVDRFERWVQCLQFVPLEKFVTNHLPPLDVWMVWHAYLLTPCWYAEDCERLAILQQLRLLNMFVVGSLNIGKLVRHKYSSSRAESWYKHTETCFDPFEAMAERTCYKQIECPQCRTRVFAPFLNSDGTGFAEEKFSVSCPLPGCKLKITKANLAVAKFVEDVTATPEGREQYIAGTLFTPAGKRDTRLAKAIKDQLLRSPAFVGAAPMTSNERLARLDWIKDIKESVDYSLERLKKVVSTALKCYPESTTSKILGAYIDGTPFSVDLVDAVFRQCFFTEKMDEVGWIKPAAFHEADKMSILENSVVRYHAFLDLAATHPSALLVPTLDIDLVWHTHQLMASRYVVDCEVYVGRYLDHEVNIAESRLSSAFEATCRAWQNRHQVPYIRCGCAAPDEASFQKFMRLVRQYLRGRSHIPALLHPEHLPATHPSIHNAVITYQQVGSGKFGRSSHRARAATGGSSSPSRNQHGTGGNRSASTPSSAPAKVNLELSKSLPQIPWLTSTVLNGPTT